MLPTTGPYTPYIHACGDAPRLARWELPRRRLAHWLLVTSLDGAEVIVVDDAVHRIRSGATYLIQPDRLHDLSAPAGNRPAWIHFDLRFDPRRGEHPHAAAYQSELGSRAVFLQPDAQACFGVDLPVVIPEALQRSAGDTVQHIIAAWRSGSARDQWSAHHLLDGLMLSLVDHVAGPGTAPDVAQRLDRAEATALRSLHTGFDLADFARAAGLSRSRFCAVFSQRHAEAPATWLRRQRIARAQDLLRRGDLSVQRVGALVGYEDPTVFGRVFRAATGVTPGVWRQRRQE